VDTSTLDIVKPPPKLSGPSLRPTFIFTAIRAVQQVGGDSEAVLGRKL
jgi:hypothetical protein